MAELKPPHSDLETPSNGAHAVAGGLLFYLGAGGLLFAMAIEAIAVTGRQLGIPLLGALEIIQTAILVTASSSMLLATLRDGHAAVRLLVDRLSPGAQHVLRTFSMLIGAAFFGCIAFALAWLARDSWNEFEQSELLHIPYRPLRIIVVVMTAAMAVTLAFKAFRRRDRGAA